MYATTTAHTGQDRLHNYLCSIAERDDVEFLTGQFAPIPQSFQPKLLKEYSQIKTSKGRKEANLWSFDLRALFGNSGINYAADDSEIIEAAEQAARDVRNRLANCSSEETTLEMLAQAAKRHEIELPHCKKTSEIVQRMIAEKWWRRQLRKRFSKIEAAAISIGCVHKRAGLYASNETVYRRQKQRRKNARLLESMEAVHNQTGQICTLAELASTNVSNPTIRRAELMTRIRGIEEFSNLIGYSGLFLTLTTPSRMHARSSIDGTTNPKYNNTRPDSAQHYLVDKVWAPVMAKLKRDGVDYFGVRIVEPHHDGTPHWHMLVFVKPDQQAHFLATIREYALRDSPNERGAQERRFTVVPINPSKGSAAGYVAKYISKNIDGFAVGSDHESSSNADASKTSERVEAWASLWRIRQFQFFGTPSVTPYRELRRIETLPESMQDVLGEAWKAADEGDWRTYMQLHRDGLRIKPHWEDRPSTNYPDEFNKRVRGVVVHGDLHLITREGEWEIREKESSREARLLTSWTCVNNSTRQHQQSIKREELLTFDDENGVFMDGIGGRFIEHREPPRTDARLAPQREAR